MGIFSFSLLNFSFAAVLLSLIGDVGSVFALSEGNKLAIRYFKWANVNLLGPRAFRFFVCRTDFASRALP